MGRKYLKPPFGLKIRWRGRNRWSGKPGRLEIVYDTLSGRWICYMPVEVEQPLHQPKGDKVAYVDPGVKCPICEIEAHRDAIGSVNIGLAQGEAIPAGVINGAVTRPLLISL